MRTGSTDFRHFARIPADLQSGQVQSVDLQGQRKDTDLRNRVPSLRNTHKFTSLSKAIKTNRLTGTPPGGRASVLHKPGLLADAIGCYVVQPHPKQAGCTSNSDFVGLARSSYSFSLK